MTAIAGIWRFDGKAGTTRCQAMLTPLSIFGPAQSDYADFGTVTLGRCLSDTVSEDRFDRQPLTSASGALHMVADVRLDNREELSRELGLSSEQLKTLSDADLLLHAFERWKTTCCGHLVGDYAFAVWDESKARLLLFRDPLGKRPLYFFRCDQYVAFASMPQGLHALSEVPKAPDTELFAEVFSQLQHFGDRSFHKDIRKVKPAHYAVLGQDSTHQYRHWNPTYEPDLTLSYEDYVERVRDLLDQATRAQLRDAKRVATHLSGGLDSTAVTTSAARHLATDGQIDAYTSVPRPGYEDPDGHRIANEGPMAAMTASLYPNINHHLIHGDSYSFLDNLHQATQYGAQPIINPGNIIWINAIARQARQAGHKILLTGDMGNLTFSYGSDAFLTERLRRGQILRFAKDISAIRRAGWTSANRATLKAFYRLIPFPILAPLDELRHPKTLLQGNRRDETLRRLRVLTEDDWTMRIHHFQNADTHSIYKAQFAQFGLDIRDPTSDRRLVEFCLNIPPHFFYHQGVPRAIARDVLKDRTPDAFLQEKRRGFQAADWHEKFVEEQDRLLEQLDIISEFDALKDMAQTDRLKASLETLPSSHWNSHDNVAAYRVSILRAVSFGDYFRRLSGSNR